MLNIVTDEELDRLVNLAPTSHHSERLRAGIALLYYGGMRASEVCGARWDGVAWADGYMRVFGKGAKWRHVPLFPELEIELRRWRDSGRGVDPSGEILQTRTGRPPRRTWLNRSLSRACKALGIRHIHPHQLRHTRATHLLRLGWDLASVSLFLGHASVSTTAIYVHSDPLRLVQLARFGPRGQA